MSDEAMIRRALTGLLARELPNPVAIEELRRLTGGASRETWSFDAVDGEGVRHELILRRDFTDGRSQNPDVLVGRKDRLDRAGEYELLRRLHAAGVPVAAPVAYPEPGDDLTDCFVMERVPGETRPWVIIHDEQFAEVRVGLATQLGAALARIHAFTGDDLPFVPRRPLGGQLELAGELLALGGPPRPALEAGMRWCRERLALANRDGLMRLVHGDFRTSNYAVGRDGLAGIFDWEFSHIGDPATDLGFACMRSWRFGADDREVTGVGSREDFFASYEAAGGPPIDPEEVRIAEVMCTLVSAGVFLIRGRGFESGADRTIEAAAIARRVAELEYDLVRLID